MKLVRRILYWSIAAAIAITTACAPACTDFTPADASCPVHHTHDCCKHQDSHSGDLVARLNNAKASSIVGFDVVSAAPIANFAYSQFARSDVDTGSAAAVDIVLPPSFRTLRI
jgi:hypothetical protein